MSYCISRTHIIYIDVARHYVSIVTRVRKHIHISIYNINILQYEFIIFQISVRLYFVYKLSALLLAEVLIKLAFS